MAKKSNKCAYCGRFKANFGHRCLGLAVQKINPPDMEKIAARLKAQSQMKAFDMLTAGVRPSTLLDIVRAMDPRDRQRLTGEDPEEIDQDPNFVETAVEEMVRRSPETPTMESIYPELAKMLQEREDDSVSKAFLSMTYQDMAVMKWEERDKVAEKRIYDALRPEEEELCKEFCSNIDEEIVQEYIDMNGADLWAIKKNIMKTLCSFGEDAERGIDPHATFNAIRMAEEFDTHKKPAANLYTTAIARLVLGTDTNRRTWHEKAATEWLKRALNVPTFRTSALKNFQIRFGPTGKISHAGDQNAYSKSADIIVIDEMPDGRIHAYVMSHKHCRNDGGTQGSQKKDLESFITKATKAMARAENKDIPLLREAISRELGRDIAPEDFSWSPGALADGDFFKDKYQKIRGDNRDARVFVGNSDDFKATFQSRQEDPLRTWLTRRRPVANEGSTQAHTAGKKKIKTA